MEYYPEKWILSFSSRYTSIMKQYCLKMDICASWNANPLRNPQTGRPIKRDGPTFKRLQKECSVSRQSLQNPKSGRFLTLCDVNDLSLNTIQRILSSSIPTCPSTVADKNFLFFDIGYVDRVNVNALYKNDIIPRFIYRNRDKSVEIINGPITTNESLALGELWLGKTPTCKGSGIMFEIGNHPAHLASVWLVAALLKMDIGSWSSPEPYKIIIGGDYSRRETYKWTIMTFDIESG